MRIVSGGLQTSGGEGAYRGPVDEQARVSGTEKRPEVRETFRRQERLRRRRDFERLRAGRTIRGVVLKLRYLQSPTGVSRLGVQVGKRVGSAVVRNRVKRRFREQFRRLKHEIKEPTDMIVSAYPESATASSAEIAEDLRQVLKKAKLL